MTDSAYGGMVPLYEYECKKCGYRFEKLQKFSDPPHTKCEKCGEDAAEQVISAPAVQFKGSGWYVTDYAKKAGGPTNSAGGESRGETKGDSKTETKADTGSSSKEGEKK